MCAHMCMVRGYIWCLFKSGDALCRTGLRQECSSCIEIISILLLQWNQIIEAIIQK